MKLDWMELLVAVLVVFRLSTMFSKESGPMKIFRKLRNAPSPHSEKGKSAREGLSCPLCLSIWFAAMVTAYLWLLGKVEPLWTPMLWLALSGAAVAMAALHPKIEQ